MSVKSHYIMCKTLGVLNSAYHAFLGDRDQFKYLKINLLEIHDSIVTCKTWYLCSKTETQNSWKWNFRLLMSSDAVLYSSLHSDTPTLEHTKKAVSNMLVQGHLGLPSLCYMLGELRSQYLSSRCPQIGPGRSKRQKKITAWNTEENNSKESFMTLDLLHMCSAGTVSNAWGSSLKATHLLSLLPQQRLL